MDMNNYVLEMLVQGRLAAMRAEGERWNRVWTARPESRRLRDILGHALIRLGHRLQGIRVVETRGTSTHGAVHG
jgi:hypothetical protein